MKKVICSLIVTMLTICAYSQEIKIKNDEVKLDEKIVAYITGKKPSLQILSLDKQYTVNAELKFLESTGKRWMVLKSLKTEKTNEADYKKFNPLNQQKSVIEAFIDKGFLSADGLNTEAIESFINGAYSGISDNIKAEANAAADKKNKIASYKISIDDAGAVFSGQNKIGTVKIARTNSSGIQSYEVLDLDGFVIATWYNMSSMHPGYNKALYEELITFDGKVMKVKPDTFGTLQYKMSTDKTALNIVGELIGNDYVLQHQGAAAKDVAKQEKLKADQEIAAKEKEADNRIYEQKPFAMDEKKAIRIIEYMLEARFAGSSFSPEAQYIMENNKVVGKKYPSHGNSNYSYYEIRLNFENNLIKNASFVTRDSNKPILLEFQNNTITRVVYKDYNVDYKLQYEVNKVTLFGKEKEAERTFVLELDGDKTKSIVETVKLDKPFTKPYVSETSKFTFDADSYTRDNIIYKREKAAEDKNILQRSVDRYSKVSKNVYKTENLENGMKMDKSRGLVKISTYDDLDRISKEEGASNYGKFVRTYFYSDNKTYDYVKDILVSENEKGIKETSISIVKDMPKVNDTVKDYEWRHGYYTLDANNDLISENRDGKHRTKVNGVWSDWKYNEM
ncbi:hypothetical protein [Flavobacterium sp. N2038]|uniref:hypothetical protein n=1 Tax=Flavobacterium sp. N2038 TaxID=2986829 RepID=UPI0022259B92|nr:hypothetical protein [Flavobacterium sp. N2038]